MARSSMHPTMSWSHNDGAVWFTDPGYGILGPYEGHKAEFELPTNVYRLDPRTGKATVMVESDAAPERHLCFSPDFKKVYVVDTACNRWSAVSRQHHGVRCRRTMATGLSGGKAVCGLQARIHGRRALRHRRQRMGELGLGRPRHQRRARSRAQR